MKYIARLLLYPHPEFNSEKSDQHPRPIASKRVTIQIKKDQVTALLFGEKIRFQINKIGFLFDHMIPGTEIPVLTHILSKEKTTKKFLKELGQSWEIDSAAVRYHSLE